MSESISSSTLAEAPPALAGWDNPPALAARGTVIVIAGRGEHPGVYERFGTRIAFDGYRVRAVGDPTADSEFVEQQIRALLADDSLPGPTVLAGSDAGALFAAALAARGRVEVDGLILAGLPVDPAVSGQPGAAAAAPDREDWDRELAARTACSTHQARLRDDRGLRRGALARALPAHWYVAADFSAVSVPVLGLHGTADAISPLEAARAAYGKAPDAQLVSILDGRHDTLNDANHRTVAATVVLFLERLRSGAGAPEIARSER
jgi:pimeloyl-ACP methyl ester carboxylesterase